MPVIDGTGLYTETMSCGVIAHYIRSDASIVNLPATLNDVETCVDNDKNICLQVDGVATGYIDGECPCSQ